MNNNDLPKYYSDVATYSLAVLGKNLLVGTIDGVYMSTDLGNSWSTLNEGFDLVQLDVGKTYGYTGLLTVGNKFLYATNAPPYRIWKRPLTDIITSAEDEDRNQIPSNFSLEQNYPNPFNPATTIRYNIYERSRVQLKIFNMLGQEIKSLINEEKEPGHYKIDFNGEKLSSGVYLYKLTAGNFTASKKMILMK